MRVGTSYKQHPVTGAFDTIVIGSGIGGLGVAVLLAKHGRQRVLVLERHYTAGGFTHVFHRPGYEWDVGVHYIGRVHRRHSMTRRIFDHVTGGKLDWADMGEVYDRIIIGDDKYDFVSGPDRFRRRMHEYFPGRGDQIDAYMKLVRGAARRANGFFAAKALPGLLAPALGPLVRAPAAKFARRTTHEMLSPIVTDKRLLGVLLGQYGDYGLPPSQSSFLMHAVLADHYFQGGAYPVGGSTRIAATMLPIIEAAGGRVFTNAAVEQIIVRGGRAVGVRMTDGNEIFAPNIVSDAGAINTIRRLMPAETARDHGLTRKLDGLAPSMGHVSLYVGLEHTDAELGLEKTNLWIYENDDHDANFARSLADPRAPFPGVFISFPSAKDPDFQRRHPGHATIEVVSFVPTRWFEKWRDTRWKKRGAEYEAMKADLSERLSAVLYKHVPRVRGKIAVAELSTPLSTMHFAGHRDGEIYGIAHDPARFAAHWLKPVTPVEGLYLTGSDVASCGVVGALMGGVLCASTMLHRNLMSTIVRN